MRLAQGASMDEVQDSLGTRQRALLTEVLDHRANEAEAIEVYEQRQAALHASVRKALKAGVPVALIADRLGVTKARVYQMRDGTR
jgi:hypothetical protein